MIHVDDAGVRLRRIDPAALDVPRRRVAHRIAAAAHAEFAADRRQRQDRHRGVAAVAVPFEPPAASNQRRRALGVQRGDRFEGGSVDAGDLRRAFERPRLGALPQLVRTGGVLAQERLVGVAVRKQVAMDRERDGDVAAGPDREMNVGAARQRGRPRVDHDQLGAALLGLADERDDVDARCRRVDAPEDDQLRLGVILVGDRRHLAVERQIGGAGRRGADRARQPRGAEPPPQLRIDVVLREHAVRSAVRIRAGSTRLPRSPWPVRSGMPPARSLRPR